MVAVAGTGEKIREMTRFPKLALCAPVFVWSVWVLMFLAAVAFVTAYGHNVPVWDDFAMVPFLTGDAAVSATWLWEQHNEHRVPLAKLIMLALYQVTDNDFRSGMYLNVGALGFLTACLILAARWLRGWTSYSDAFFPLAMLNWGHSENFLWAWQITYVVPVVLIGLLLVCVIGAGKRMSLGYGLTAGSCLVLLPLCGPVGLSFVPASALWLGYAGMLRWRSADPKRDGLALIALASAALVLVPLYFIGYEKPTYHLSSPSNWDSLRSSVQFLSLIFGYRAWSLWPFSGLSVVSLALISTGALVVAWYRRPGEQLRVLALLCLLVGAAVLAAGIGWGRAGSGYFGGFTIRYVTLTVPALCCIYFVSELYCPSTLRSWAQFGLFTLSGFIFVFNIQISLNYGQERSRQMEAFARDLSEGVPPSVLAHRYVPLLHHDHEAFAEYLRMLHRAGIGRFVDLREDPPFLEVPISMEPIAVNQMTWSMSTGRGTGRDSYLLFSVPDRTYVTGLRITYSHANREGTNPVFEVFWKPNNQSDFTGHYANRYLATGPEENSVTVYVCDTIDQFRIHPDSQAFTFGITNIVLLVPAADKPD